MYSDSAEDLVILELLHDVRDPPDDTRAHAKVGVNMSAGIPTAFSTSDE